MFIVLEVNEEFAAPIAEKAIVLTNINFNPDKPEMSIMTPGWLRKDAEGQSPIKVAIVHDLKQMIPQEGATVKHVAKKTVKKSSKKATK